MFDLVNPAIAFRRLGREDWHLGSNELGQTD
jgi:hypothetical protein